MPDTMIERVAIAIRKELGLDWPYAGHGTLMEVARAILTAMREPTEVMRDAGADELPDRWADNPSDNTSEAYAQTADVWRAMIDAALAEEG
jgi:hypothetical protein